jgi:hypothetical protein
MRKTDTERLEHMRQRRMAKRKRREARQRRWLERHPIAQRRGYVRARPTGGSGQRRLK